MPAKISRAVVCDRPGLNTSIELSAQAGRDCVGEAGLAESDVGLLLNIGVYRSSNILEPALASLIQGQMGLNNRPITGKGREASLGPHTFSLDLVNGTCGFFSAVQVATSFMATGTTDNVLVVSSDVHPSNERRDDFPYTQLGAAMLLTSSAGHGGFQRVMHKSSEDPYVGSASYSLLGAAGAHGRSALTVEVDEQYADRLADFVEASLREYVERSELDVASIKYVVAPRHPGDLHATVVKVLGISEDRFIDSDARFGRTFSAQPILGYRAAEEAGLAEGDSILFVGAGAGLTFGCCLYVA
jgi:3-oxoacyl-[acyl-carrier-protein] synthase III